MLRALIVDSSEFWAQSLKQILELEGVSIEAWKNRGTGWIESLNESEPDLIFLDDQLMSRSGIACLEKLSGMASYRKKIVFMHSMQGVNGDQLELSAITRGATWILRKPFKKSELLKILKANAE